MKIDNQPERSDVDVVLQADSAKHKRILKIGELKPRRGQQVFKLVEGKVFSLREDDYVDGVLFAITFINKNGRFGLRRNKRIKQDPKADAYVCAGSKEGAKKQFNRMGFTL